VRAWCLAVVRAVYTVHEGGKVRGEKERQERLSVHSLVTPSVWWAEVTLALNSLHNDPSTYRTPSSNARSGPLIMISTLMRLIFKFAANSLLYRLDIDVATCQVQPDRRSILGCESREGILATTRH